LPSKLAKSLDGKSNNAVAVADVVVIVAVVVAAAVLLCNKLLIGFKGRRLYCDL